MHSKVRDTIIDIFAMVPLTVLFGGSMILATTTCYSLHKSVMDYIQSVHINNDITKHFSPLCKESFHNEEKVLWLHSSLRTDNTTVATQKRWKQNGKWEECMRN